MALGILATLVGCGSAPPPLEDPAAAASDTPAQAPQEYPAPASPGLQAPPPPASLSSADREPHIEDALAELNRAETAVNQLLAPSPDPAVLPSPGGSPEPRPQRPPRDAQKAPDTPPAIAASDRCEIACRALASMQSAARHLCSLAGETDVRCHNARARVQGAQTRVRAGCPSCPEAQ